MVKRNSEGLQTEVRADKEPGVLVRSLTSRSIVVGALGAFLIGVGVPYANMIIRGSPMASYFNTRVGTVFGTSPLWVPMT